MPSLQPKYTPADQLATSTVCWVVALDSLVLVFTGLPIASVKCQRTGVAVSRVIDDCAGLGWAKTRTGAWRLRVPIFMGARIDDR